MSMKKQKQIHPKVAESKLGILASTSQLSRTKLQKENLKKLGIKSPDLSKKKRVYVSKRTIVFAKTTKKVNHIVNELREEQKV